MVFRRSPCIGSRRGTSALEFAVILPVLLTLVLGCVDFGRFANSYIVVTNAARVGASYATVNPSTAATSSLWQANVTQAVAQEMAGLSQFNASLLSVQTTVIPNDDPTSWSVQVSVAYPFQTLIPWPGIPESTNLRQTVIMRTIQP